MAPTRILYVVTEDWYFLSHRLPMARAAKAAGYEHVATRLNKGQGSDRGRGLHPACADLAAGQPVADASPCRRGGTAQAVARDQASTSCTTSR